MAFMEILAAVGIPVLRGVYGWLQVAMEDGYIDEFEWTRLGETVMRISVITVTGYYGFTLAGVDIPVASAALIATLFDLLRSQLRR